MSNAGGRDVAMKNWGGVDLGVPLILGVFLCIFRILQSHRFVVIFSTACCGILFA